MGTGLSIYIYIQTCCGKVVMSAKGFLQKSIFMDAAWNGIGIAMNGLV